MPPAIARRTLAALYVCLDRMDDARSAIAALLDKERGYSISEVRETFRGKLKAPCLLERSLGDLRSAGLPE